MTTQKAQPRRSLDVLGGIAPATPAAVEATPADVVSAIQAAPTTQVAFEALTVGTTAPPATDVSLGRVKASIATLDASIEKGRRAVLALRRTGDPVPLPWVERLQDLERQRLDAVWGLDGRRIELGLMTVDPATITISYPTALAARLSDRAIERTRDMVAWRHGCWPDVVAFDPASEHHVIEPELAIAWEQLAEHAHGWDVENLTPWLHADVAAHVAVVVCGVGAAPEQRTDQRPPLVDAGGPAAPADRGATT